MSYGEVNKGGDHVFQGYQSTLVLIAESNSVLGGLWFCSGIANQ